MGLGDLSAENWDPATREPRGLGLVTGLLLNSFVSLSEPFNFPVIAYSFNITA